MNGITGIRKLDYSFVYFLKVAPYIGDNSRIGQYVGRVPVFFDFLTIKVDDTENKPSGIIASKLGLGWRQANIPRCRRLHFQEIASYLKCERGAIREDFVVVPIVY